jgi:cation transport ATPase
VVRLLDGSRRVLGIIRRGLTVSLVYNAIAATLAMTGLINPILAAVLMPASSLTVVSLAYRSKTFTR